MFILRLIRKIEIIISDRNHYDDILRRGGERGQLVIP